MSDRDELLALARKVAAMRDKQREYFDASRRKPSTLGESKALEREVDRMTAELLDDRPGLFDRKVDGGRTSSGDADPADVEGTHRKAQKGEL